MSRKTGDSFSPITVEPATYPQAQAYPQSNGEPLYVARVGVAEMESEMSDDSVCLLKECSSGCKMACKSIRQVKEFVKDKKLESILDRYKDKHEKIEQEVIAQLGEHGKHDEEPSAMAKMFSWVDTEIKMLMNADAHKISKIMMDGCNMGIQSVSEYINKYTGADEDSVNTAKKLVKTEEDFMEEMKAFV